MKVIVKSEQKSGAIIFSGGTVDAGEAMKLVNWGE